MYTAAEIEELLKISAIEDAGLEVYFAGGRRLDLKRLSVLLLNTTIVDATGGFDAP
ncbi:MAG: hypothetical protein HC902_00850 [Calothrix sp. SM1_5_4]|nr:hypothetical protein [Calothrix sp. SM1_5_4]